MNKYFLILFAFLLFTGILSAQNHMDIMTTMTGEHDHSSMGRLMTTLDWNGDGNDDLVISSPNWDPRGYTPSYPPFPYGKLYVYFGGTNFDNVPEMEIPGHHEIEYGHTTSMCNAGDMNGDSIDDLALFRATMYEENIDQFYDLQLCIFYGGANPDTIPDYVLTFPREEWENEKCDVRSLGDINHDGFDDIGYIMARPGFVGSNTYGIIYGGSLANSVFLVAGSPRDVVDMHGVGDINTDGTDDFCIGYKYDIADVWSSKVILYYGKSTAVYSDSLVICDDSNIRNPYAYPSGDLNGDGYSDFVSEFTMTEAKIYYGGPGFNGSIYDIFAPPYNGNSSGEGFSHGDVNGDGRDDLMGTNVTQANGYGDAYLWMGGIPMNGAPDLHLTPTLNDNNKMYGWCLTMGDYNGDGCCDAAISAPFDYSGSPYPGNVFVYAGNSQLDDTPNADETATPVISKMQLYPNPLQPQKDKLNVIFKQLTPLPPSSRGVKIGSPSSRGVKLVPNSGRGVMATFEIYNIKGQKVKSFVVTAEQSKTGFANYNLNNLSSGVYVCVFSCGQTQHRGKITVIR